MSVGTALLLLDAISSGLAITAEMRLLRARLEAKFADGEELTSADFHAIRAEMSALTVSLNERAKQAAMLL